MEALPTSDEILAALRGVVDPELGADIVELGMARSATVSDAGAAVVVVALTTAGCPLKAQLKREILTRIEGLPGVTSASIDWVEMDAEQKAAAMDVARKHAQSTAGPNRVPPGARVLAVASGKGGVGKSSVTANLAAALADRGFAVGVIDADIWGFSIPRMLGVNHTPTIIDEMIVPPEAHGVRCISMGFFVEEDQPVIWRGPMLHKALEQFLTDVFWDEPDFLLVDLPPGTGDIALSLAQFLPRAELYVVTTPQPAAQKVAQRAAFMAEKVNIEVKGVIENMSWFTGDDGKRYELFGAGGGAELAERLDVRFVGQVPLVPALREGSDDGRPVVAVEPESEAAVAIRALAEVIDLELAPTRRYNAGLKLLG